MRVASLLRRPQNEFEFVNITIEHARIRGKCFAERGIGLPNSLNIRCLHSKVEEPDFGEVIQLRRNIKPQQRMKNRQWNRIARFNTQVITQARQAWSVKIEIRSNNVIREKDDMDRFKK